MPAYTIIMHSVNTSGGTKTRMTQTNTVPDLKTPVVKPRIKKSLRKEKVLN